MEVKDLEKQIFRKLISNPGVLAQYITKVSPEDFTTPIIKSVMASFASNSNALTHYVPSKNFFEILMRDRFHNPTELDQVSNVLAGLASNPVDIKDLDMLIREIKANRMCREMALMIQKTLPGIKPDSVDSAYENLLRDLLQLPLNAASGINIAKLREIHDALDERALEYLNPAVARMPTGIRAFDAAMGGYAAGEFILISAGVGHGKSYFMLWLAEQMVEAGNNILYITIEMSYAATMDRYNSIQTGFNSLDISDKRIPESQRARYFEKLIAANKEKTAREAFLRECATLKDRSNPHGALALAKKYKNRPAKFFLMDLPSGCTPARVEQEIQRLSMDNKLDCVFVDFINVMDPTFHNKERSIELARVSRELKVAARKTGVRLFSAAQLDTTKMDGNQDEVITTDHIKYAKAIGENADWMMAFYRTAEDNLKKQLRIQMAKTRGGPAVTALLEFDFSTSQSIDLGFADDSPIPYGYLKNGYRTDGYIAEQEAKDPVQTALGSLSTDEPQAQPQLPSPDDRDVEIKKKVEELKDKFDVVGIKEVKQPIVEEEALGEWM